MLSQIRATWRSVNRLRRGIGARLLASVLLFSAAVTLILTLFQLYFDYRHDVGAIESRLSEIEGSYLQSLGEGLWNLDSRQLELQIEGILRLPAIRFVEVRETTDRANPMVVSGGRHKDHAAVSRAFALFHTSRGSQQRLGVLSIEATFDEVYRALLDKAIIISISQGTTIFLVSFFILYITHQLVTRHLTALAGFLGKYDLRQPPPPLRLQRRAPKDKDELDQVIAALAAMALESSRLYRELQERESKIRRLVDANVVGVLISHLDGQVVEANDAFLDMVGFTRDDLASGRIKWTELTPPEWQPASQRAVEQLRATGSADLFEKEYFRKDGSRVPVLVAAAALAGTPAQTVAFVVDLRERKAAEEALLRAREELARVTRVSTVGELAASIAHEINQPLAAVATYAGAALLWLQRDPPNLERARDALRRTMHEGERAGEIVSRVRALVKKAPPRTEAVDIDEVILAVLDLSRDELQRNGISIRTQLATGKPLVRGDRIQLQQVVLNLILNAVDAMSKPGTSPRELSIASRREEANQVLVEVRDSGRGFQAETMERIFDPFFTTKPDGMGMGLSISRSIVVAHGGRLWAMANEPRGAVFQFALPAGESDTRPKA
jgi:PAS domain S-box-containing protein